MGGIATRWPTSCVRARDPKPKKGSLTKGVGVLGDPVEEVVAELVA